MGTHFVHCIDGNSSKNAFDSLEVNSVRKRKKDEGDVNVKSGRRFGPLMKTKSRTVVQALYARAWESLETCTLSSL